MKAVVQRVFEASVTVSGVVIGRIEAGLLVYIGIENNDSDADLEYMVRKIVNLRIFQDSNGKMNRSIIDTGGSVLLVSQFTLCADTRKGNRPSFNPAAPQDIAERYYHQAVELFSRQVPTESGQFGAEMFIHSCNAGPVTILLDTRSSSDASMVSRVV